MTDPNDHAAAAAADTVPDVPANSTEAFSKLLSACGCRDLGTDWRSWFRSTYDSQADQCGPPLPRAYHNWRHLTTCLLELDSARPHHTELDLPAIEMALWFHDLVYDPRSATNEEDSAQAAADFLNGAGASQALVRKVCALILATKHRPPEGGTDADTALLLDIDLSILGQDREVYDEYERAIREEYLWVPEAVFVEKRREILRQFLAREPLYLTPYFRQKYEAKAKRNLRRAVSGER